MNCHFTFLHDYVMKGSPEQPKDTKVPKSTLDLTREDLRSAELNYRTNHTSSRKEFLWSNIFSSFSIFETSFKCLSEKKESNHRGHGWTTTVRRAVIGGPMRRFHERILGFRKSGVCNSSSDIWLLGSCYGASEDSVDNPTPSSGSLTFIQDFSSRIWITYRKGFDPIGDSKYTSDVNWGCMIRSSQMLVAQALLFHYLGRSWRRPSQKCYEKEYINILQLFGDSETSSFSIHNLLQAGQTYGLSPDSWLGPYAMCRTWESLVCMKKDEIETGGGTQSLPMAIYIVSGDEDGERGGAPVVYIEDATKLCSEFSRGSASAILLLVPLVLGLDKINQRYIPSLWATFTFPQSVGILGGKPGASTYVVGVQDDQALYLDPHEVQPVCSITSDDLEVDTSSYHCSIVKRVPLEMLDPSLAIGFYCRDKDDFDDFCLRASELANCSNGAPLFTVAHSHDLSNQANLREESIPSQGTYDIDKLGKTDETHSHEDDWQFL